MVGERGRGVTLAISMNTSTSVELGPVRSVLDALSSNAVNGLLEVRRCTQWKVRLWIGKHRALDVVPHSCKVSGRDRNREERKPLDLTDPDIWRDVTAEEQAYASQQGLPSASETSAVVAKAAAQGFASKFVGVSWDTQQGRWRAAIRQDGINHRLGRFVDEHEAARAFDTAARNLRPTGKAHGGRQNSGRHAWQRVNFPTVEEEAFAAQEGLPGVIPD